MGRLTPICLTAILLLLVTVAFGQKEDFKKEQRLRGPIHKDGAGVAANAPGTAKRLGADGGRD
jgi:hypothetical protein